MKYESYYSRPNGNIYFFCVPTITASPPDGGDWRYGENPWEKGRIGDCRQETGDRRQETGDGSQSGSMSDTDTGTDSETQTPDASK